jgi:hypothetical protein
MPTIRRRRTQSLGKYIFNKLTEAGWIGLDLNRTETRLTCPKGEILKLSQNNYHLKFFSYSGDPRQYFEREGYGEIIFPKTFSIKSSLYFRRNGKYTISCETQFKKIINPLKKDTKKIKVINGTGVKKFYSKNLILSTDIFTKARKDAENVFEVKDSYAKSADNYLSKKASYKYGDYERNRTTYIERGEFAFLIDRLNLSTKVNKKDYQRYLDINDLSSLEIFLEELLKKDVLSENFTRKLNDYFIKEKLRDIIALGKNILELGTTNLTGVAAQAIISKLEIVNPDQLETLWQRYFEKYLLYLIFSYKKIFPKVELENVEGDKKYPDFIGINHYNGLDIIEIKTHLKNILVWDGSHQNFYFSGEMSKAIVQTMNYMDSISQERFKNAQDRDKITDFVDEENLYHPRGIIIISSDKKLSTKNGEDEKLKRDFTKLRNSLNNIEILTFNDILNIADEYIKNIVESDALAVEG